MKKIFRMQLLVTMLLSLIATNLLAAEKLPSVIRIGAPGASYGKPFTSGASGFVHAKALLEEEFKKDGIKVEWSLFRGAGPAVNEAFANNLLDFAYLGDIALIINKSSGLKTRLIAAGAAENNAYLVVPSDSTITSLAELKGKRIAVFKGTVFSLIFERVAARYGLSSKDFKVYNLDPASAASALKTKDIDAGLFLSDAFALELQGAGKIIDSTRNDPPSKFANGLLVTEKFAAEYPELTKRLVKVWVKAAKAFAEDRDAGFLVWTKSGVPLAAFKKDYGTTPGKTLSNPLLDEYYVKHIKDAVVAAKETNIIRKAFDVDQFIDRSYLDAVIKEEGLEKYWDSRDGAGNKL